MTAVVNMPSRKTIILVGLIGCFLTSLAGISGSMLIIGWSASGGWVEWMKRLGLGYPFSCLIVFFIFPAMIPRLNQLLESAALEETASG